MNNISLAIVRYSFDDEKLARLTELVAHYYRLRPRFDMKFDLSTDDELYCTEFVYKAFKQTMNDTNFTKPTVFMGRTFVGTDDLSINAHARMVWRKRFK
jgi:hypothetical protein